MKQYVFIYLALMTTITYLFFWVDKQKAKKKKRRISEKNLHLLEAGGGFIGAILAMQIVRHKNRKSSFYLKTYGITALWIIGIYFVFFHFKII